MTTNQTIDGVPRELRSVLAMILNALDRDAADGKAARGEMASELRALLDAPAHCAHEWTDDGEFTLTCTKCSKKESHEPYGWVQTRGDAINQFTQEWDVVESWVERGFEYKAMFDHIERDREKTGTQPQGDPAGSFDKHMQYMQENIDLKKRIAELEAIQPQGEPSHWADPAGNTITAELKAYNLKLGGAPAAASAHYADALYRYPPEQPQGEQVAMSRDQFEAWVLGREHPTYGWLDKHWLTRGDNPDTYATEYVQGLWVASQTLYAEQPAPVLGKKT